MLRHPPIPGRSTCLEDPCMLHFVAVQISEYGSLRCLGNFLTELAFRRVLGVIKLSVYVVNILTEAYRDGTITFIGMETPFILPEKPAC